MSSSVNWRQLQDQLGEQLAASLQGIAQGAASDIQAFANQISAELVMALSTGDKSAVHELKAQLLLIAETNRVRLAIAQEGMALKLIGVVLNAATSGLLAAGTTLAK